MAIPDSQSRLAFYLPALASGGMERVTLLLAQALADRGYAVDIVLEHRRGGYLDRVPDGVTLVVLEKGPKLPPYARLIGRWPREGLAQLMRLFGRKDCYIPLRRLLCLAHYIEHQCPCVVFAAHGRIPFLALWAARIAAVNTKVVVIEHSTFSRWLDVFRNDPRTHAVLSYRRALMHRLYPQADAVVGVSDGVADDLAAVADIDRRLITTIYNPVVGPELAHLAAESPGHDWLRDDGPPVILAVGRLVEEKGFIWLIEAFATLRGAGVAARLLILGEGPQRDELADRAAALGVCEDVAMPGWVDNPYACMARAGVFVLSSMFEGLPVAPIEALTCGCPVVAFDCPSGPREILADGRFGTLVAVGDTDGLAAAIGATLAHPPATERLIERGAWFSVDRAVDAYEQLIRQVCG